MSSLLLEELEEVSRAIGGTPVLKLGRLAGGRGEVYAKLEYTNPGGSHKDRAVLYMVRDLAEKGLLEPGGLVVEASSGNTAISLSWIARRLGVRALIVVRESVSERKKRLIRLLGAELVEVSPGVSEHEVAEALAERMGGVFLGQASNTANMRAHYETTGPEIYRQLGGRLDYFVMGMGTCGTIAGVGKYLREKLGSSVKIVGVTPRGSLLAGGRGEERIEGLASSDAPPLCLDNMGIIDEVVEVSSRDAARAALLLAEKEGILAGFSTGAALHASLEILERDRGARIALIAADSMSRYESLV